MPASLHDWIDRLKTQPLPVLALTVRRVSALMARPSSTHADYQRIIARDPGFVLSIFRYLGNLPRPPREPITTLTHALSLSGMAPLEAGLKTLPVIKDGSAVDSRRGLLTCYSRAVHAAMYLSQWIEVRKDFNPEELTLAALLHDCGEMTLWSAAPDQMAAVEMHVAQGLSRDNASLAVLGFSLTQLSLRLAEIWGLPPLIRDALSPDGAFRPRPLGVMLACELALRSASNWGSLDSMELIELAAEYCRQTTDQSVAALHAMSAETARQLQGLNLPVSASALLHLQVETDESPHSASLQVNDRTEPLARSTPATALAAIPAPPPATESALQKSPSAQPIQSDAEPSVESDSKAHRQQNILVGTASPSVTPKTGVESSDPDPLPAQRQTGGSLQIQLTRTMKQLRDDSGLERAMFAMLTPDRKSLRARFVLGAEKDAAIKTFQVSLDKRHLFSVLLSKPQSFWMNADNRSKYLPSIPAYLHNTLNTQGFFVTSLFIEDRALGILYADCSSAAELDNGSFTCFKQLAWQLSMELSDARKPQAVG